MYHRKNLKSARISKKFTQKNVAEYLGMTANSYQAIELGIRGTSETNWIKLFQLFNAEFPLNELMLQSSQVQSLQGEKNSPNK